MPVPLLLSLATFPFPLSYLFLEGRMASQKLKGKDSDAPNVNLLVILTFILHLR